MTEQQPSYEELVAEVRRLRAERDQFADRVDTLTAVAKGNKRHVQEMFLELQKAQARVAELEAGQTPHTPRLCECGHSHHAHTVPAPHSCFAYGKTCPCEAYRQLPHDKAVAQLKANQQAAAERAVEESHVVADDSDDPEHIDDRAILRTAPDSSDDWDDATWAAWWRTAERVHGDAPAARSAAV